VRYALAEQGVFWTIQGEAHLRGFQMAFVRLAGCSVGCPNCDTDYKAASTATPDDIATMLAGVVPPTARDRWVWITGGEPADYDLRPLIWVLREHRYSVAVASSGHKRIIPPVDWLSVSPHDPAKWIQTYGNEVKLVAGLNGLRLDDFIKAHPDDQTDFMYRYVQPLWKDGREDPGSMTECLDFLKERPNWALSRQDHKHWGVA
jgi:organic radical activating enzyme